MVTSTSAMERIYWEKTLNITSKRTKPTVQLKTLREFFLSSCSREKYIDRAIDFYIKHGEEFTGISSLIETKKKLLAFYDGKSKRSNREEHMSMAVLKNHLAISLAEPEIIPKILATWENEKRIDPRIRGDFHIHTEFSDSLGTTKEVIKTAKILGYSWIALTDHALTTNRDYTMSADKFFKRKEISEKIAPALGIRVYQGIEANILEDGSLDIPEEIESHLDLAIVSLHKTYNQPYRKILERIERALNENPRVIALTHPFFAMDVTEQRVNDILDIVEKANKAVEINLFPIYFKGNKLLFSTAMKRGIKIIFSTDAHCPKALYSMKFANSFLKGIDTTGILNLYDNLQGVIPSSHTRSNL